MVERHLLSPARLGVAALATITELTLVRIALLVARDAGRRELFFIDIALVTTIAFNLLVFALQRKLGLGVVEACLFPFLGCVAGLAFLSVTACMRILRPMAIDAGAR